MTSYAIIGSGALGGLYGGMLSNAGHDVHFLLRSDYDHVVQNGLRIDSIWGDIHLARPNVYRHADEMPPCEVTILATKTTSNHQAAELLGATTGQGGRVLVLQNGLNIETPAIEAVGRERVLSGCCFLCSNKVGPGHIHHLDQGRIVFGCLDGPADDFARRIAGDLCDAGVPTQTTDDLAMVRWRKLMWNIPFNGLSVVLDASTKQLIEHPASVRLAKTLIDEVHRGAASIGVVIEDKHKEATLEATRKMVPYDSSMRLDYRHGREMEIEAIFDNPLAAAAVAMPSVAMLRDQLRFLNRS